MKKEQLYEVLGDINENYVNDAHMTAKKSAYPIWLKWVAMAACLCLVVSGAFVLPRLQNNKNVLLVNTVDGVASADMDVQFTYYPDPSEDKSDDVLIQFKNVTGLNYNNFVAKIPFVKERFYSVDVPSDAAAAYIPHDFVFDYQTNYGGEITIAICAKEEPLRDLFVICDNPKQSEINGIPVVILGYQDSFMVQFSWQSVNYDIETRSITLGELEQLLVCLIS